MRATCPLVVLLLGVVSGAAQVARSEIVIGVMSPTGGRKSIGRAHEKTIAFAFERVASLRAGDIDVPLRAEVRVYDRSDPAAVVAAARELADIGAVAILGPVDSRSTAALLRAHLEIPVLSALSTAQSLSTDRDEWFFRLTVSDDERMQQYADTLQRHAEIMPAPLVVLYNKPDPYGEGLFTGLTEALQLREPKAMPWSDIVADGSVSDANSKDVAEGRGFKAATVDAALTPTPGTVFVLGVSTGAVAIARGIEEYLRAHGVTSSPRFHFVGADSELRTGAPEGSFAIGEPTIVDAHGNEAEKVLMDWEVFAQQQDLDPEDFIVTAYEAAYYILPRALGEVLGSVRDRRPSDGRHPGLPPATELRRPLRDQLEKLEFESMEPWRTIRLRGGQMSGAPVVPVYRITRRLDLVDIPKPQPYLSVDIPDEMGFLEGPVIMHVLGHAVDLKEIEFKVLNVESNRRVPLEQRLLSDGRVEVAFYPRWPGRYGLEPNRRFPMNPANRTIVVRLGYAYPVALAGALLGSLLFVMAVTQRMARVSWQRVILGVITGLLLAGLSLHRTFLPGTVAFPSFGDSLGVNAFWAGFVGGWFGPGALMLLIGRLMPAGSQGPPAPDTPGRVAPAPTEPHVEQLLPH